MNWDAVGAIAQGVSALALVFLFVQIGHARAEARRALSQGRAEAVRDLVMWSSDERINRIVVKANTALNPSPDPLVRVLIDRTGLTLEEALVVFYWQLAWWNHTVQGISSVNELPAMERVQFDYGVMARLRSGVGRLFYEQVRGLSHPDAIQYVDRVLARSTWGSTPQQC